MLLLLLSGAHSPSLPDSDLAKLASGRNKEEVEGGMRYGREKKGAGDLGFPFNGGEHANAISTLLSSGGAHPKSCITWGKFGGEMRFLLLKLALLRW